MKTLRKLPLVLTVVCVAALFSSVDVRQSLSLLPSVDLHLFGAVCCIAVTSRSMRSFKWNLLLRSQGVEVSFWSALAVNWVGSVFAFWTPAGLGSDAYRFAALSRHGQRNAVASTLVVERYAGLCSVCLVWVASLPFSFVVVWRDAPRLAVLLLVVPAVCLGLLPLLFSERLPRSLAVVIPARTGRIRKGLVDFAESLAQYRRFRGRLLVFFALSVAEVCSYILINYLSARALGFQAPLSFFLWAMPPVYLILRLPISLQGWGVQEGALGYAMTLIGFDPAAGVAISLLQRAVELICFVLPGAVLASRRSVWSPVASKCTATNRS